MAEKEWVSLADLLYPVGSYYYCELETPENEPSKFFGGDWILTETQGVADPITNKLTWFVAPGRGSDLRCYLRVG